MNPARTLLIHLPLMATVLILGFFSLVDSGHLDAFRNESTFGWMIVFWYPLCMVLGLMQLVLWGRWISKHGVLSRPLPGRTRRILLAGSLLVLAAVLCLLVVRMAQRYGLLQG